MSKRRRKKRRRKRRGNKFKSIENDSFGVNE